MRIDEFEKKLNALGFNIYVSNGEYFVVSAYDKSFIIAVISYYRNYLSLTEDFFTMRGSMKSKTNDLFIQFAGTSVEERKLPKKYYLEVDNDKWNYPYLKYEGEHYELVSIDKATPFTLEEGEKAAAVLGIKVKAVEV